MNKKNISRDDYKIIVEVEASGKRLYSIKKRFLYYFWINMIEVRDISLAHYKIIFGTLEKAETYISKDINKRYKRKQSRIVKTYEYVSEKSKSN